MQKKTKIKKGQKYHVQFENSCKNGRSVYNIVYNYYLKAIYYRGSKWNYQMNNKAP